MVTTEKLTEIQLRDEIEQLETQKQTILLSVTKLKEEARIRNSRCAQVLLENKELNDLKLKYENELQKCNEISSLKEDEIRSLNILNSDLKQRIDYLEGKLNSISRSSEINKNRVESLAESKINLKNAILKLWKQIENKNIENSNLLSKSKLAQIEIFKLNEINQHLLIENKCFGETITEYKKSLADQQIILTDLTKDKSELNSNIEMHCQKIKSLEEQLLSAEERNKTFEKHIQLLSNKINILEEDLLTNGCQLKQAEKKMADVSNRYEAADRRRAVLEESIIKCKEKENNIISYLDEIIQEYMNIFDDKNINSSFNSIQEKLLFFKKIFKVITSENVDLLHQKEKLLDVTDKLTSKFQSFQLKSDGDKNKTNTSCHVDAENPLAKKLSQRCQHLQTRISNLEKTLQSKEKAKSMFISFIREELSKEENVRLLYTKKFNSTDELTFKILKEILTKLLASYNEAIEQKKKLQIDLKSCQKRFEALANEREIFNKQMFERYEVNHHIIQTI